MRARFHHQFVRSSIPPLSTGRRKTWRGRGNLLYPNPHPLYRARIDYKFTLFTVELKRGSQRDLRRGALITLSGEFPRPTLRGGCEIADTIYFPLPRSNKGRERRLLLSKRRGAFDFIRTARSYRLLTRRRGEAELLHPS